MLPLPRGAAWQTLFLLCAVLFINEVRSEGRVVCYYTNWSVYRPGTAKFNPQNINPYLCTHLVYAFGGFTKDNQMKPFDKYQDVEQGGYAKFTGLKTYNKQLKTMIAIGGWNEASSRFSPLMANPERRQQFIKNILKFLRQNHFDGIDLDWEYPAQREGGKPRDRDNYAQFVQELRAEFERESQKTGRPRLLVTMAVPAGIENIEKGYDIPKLNKYLDWFNVLSYDFHSSHEPSANHHAPLYSLEEESEYNYDAELNIDYSIKYYLKAGADRDKLVLGIPTYGRSYTLINEESTEIGAPSEGPGEQGDATREKGYLAYYEICQNLKEDPEWTVVQPNPNAMGPYAYRRNQWVGYDDEAIVRKKAQYVVEHGLGGIMFWAIDNDDFRGTCTGKPYPLIEAAKESMLESLGLGINEVAKHNAPKKPSRSRSRENSSSKLNRIGGSSEGKGAGRTTLSSGRRRGQASTTTTTTSAPGTTIRLTNPEGSSLYIGGRVTTPAPPTTPDPGTDFKCEEEGFFQHPRDCKKYYWCLDSGPSGLGIVGHQFTCPSGLYFNPAADSCDFARNVPCKTKKATTPLPVSSTTTSTTTTPRPTAYLNRVTAATSRTSLFRTTTTTSTTPAPIEYEDEEEEEVDDEAPTHTKDRDAEEDPQVIKELIELIRKVGGVEELEKHLLRKDDGTISIKGSASSESGGATTPTPISKNLYDKVLSKPNTFNSFRNRFTSSSLFRKASSGQTNTEESTSGKQESGESQSSEGASNSGYSKYSSVVRGNSRQGPQNEGLDKLTEFDGFLKEKKQYVTINRHRGAFRGQEDDEEVDEREASVQANDDIEEEEFSSRSKSTRKPTNTVTPSYANIRRTRPTTVRTDSDEEIASDAEVKASKESEERRTYTSLNRNRARITTTESSQATNEAITNANRYKYLERTRPTNRIPTTSSEQEEEISLAHNEEEQEDDEQNVTVQLNGATNDSKQKSTQTTTRIYANIGRRTTTETPITNTQETPTRYNLLENLDYNNETPEPNLPTTLTAASDSPTTLSITIKNTNPQVIPIQTTAITDSITSTTARTTTNPSNDIDLTEAVSTITTLPPNFVESVDSNEALDLSLDVNSLIEKSTKTVETQESEVAEATLTTPTTARTTTATRTTTKETLTSTATASGTGTATTTTDSTDQNPDSDANANADDEVTNLNSNKRLRTQQQYKFITRTRNVTKATATATATTTTNTDTDTDTNIENVNENENETGNNNNNNNNKFTKETLKKKTSLKTTGNSSSGGTSTADKLSSNIRGNTVKYSGGRRQQQQQQQQQQQLNELLTTRKNLNHNQQLDSKTDSTNIITTTDSTPTNEFLGTVSSPRPFGFPRRRTRPNSTTTSDTQTTTTTTTTTTTATEGSSEDDLSLVKTRLSASNAAKNKKYQFNRARFSTTTTATPTTSTTIATSTSATPRTAAGLFVPKQLYKSNRNRTATTTNQVNALVDVKGNEDDDEEDEKDEVEDEEDEEEEDEEEEEERPGIDVAVVDKEVNADSTITITTTTSTTSTTDSTLSTSPAPTLRRIRVLKYRRPISGNNNATLISNSVSVSVSGNTTNSSVTNTINTAQESLDTPKQVERTRLEPFNSTDSNTQQETQSETPVSTEQPKKRFRKVIRKLIRPVNRTTTTEAPPTSEVTAAEEEEEVTHINVSNQNAEKETKSDIKIESTRTNLFSRNGRTRFGNRLIANSSEKTTHEAPDALDAETETEAETEDEDEATTTQNPRSTFVRPIAEDRVNVPTGFKLPSRRPFVLTRISSTTASAVENETTENEDGNENEYSTEDEEELQQGQQQKPEIGTTRLRKLLPEVNTTTIVTTNTLEETKEADTTQTKPTTPIVRLPFGLGARIKAAEPDSNTKTEENTTGTTTTLPRRPFGLNARTKATQSEDESESHTEVETNIVGTTTTTPRRPFGLGVRTQTAENESESQTDVQENVEVTTKTTPLTRPTFRRKLVARRPYVPPKVSGVTISTTLPTTLKPKKKFVRRKFGRFHPFNAANRNTGEGFVRTDPRNQLLPETKRFRIENGKRVPIPDSEQLDEDDEYEEYEDEEDEESTTYNDQNKAQTPFAAVTLRPVTRPAGLFNRAPTTLLHAAKEKDADTEVDNETTTGGNDEDGEDEDDEEDDEEEEEEEEEQETETSDDDVKQSTPKSNTPFYHPKDNRVPPGARPALPNSSTPASGNAPFNGRTRQPQPSNAGRANGNRFGTSAPGNTRATNRPRVVNRPQGVVPPSLPLKPIATTFERTTPVVPTKPAPFISTNTRSYERKYTATSTETPETISDNSLIEDLNIEALNARNKKIFDINSKKHTTLKPKIAISGAIQTPTDQEQDTQDHLRQNTETESDDVYTADVSGAEQGFLTTTPRTSAASDTNTDYYLNANEISSQDNGGGGERTLFTTPQTPTTTLLHVFTLTDDEQTNRPPIDSTNTIGRLVPEKTHAKHKVVEINRIVEITSKADKLRRKSKANQEFTKPIGASQLRVESLPHLEQLGEISVVKFVHLVDGSDISIDGHSTVTDYTPTEPTVSAPVRNSLPEGAPYFVPQYAYSTESAQTRTTLEQRNGKALIPEVIRSAVETSTISLEGLFEGGRQGKELNSINYPYYIFGSDETTTTSTTTVKENINANENDNETQNSLNTTPKTQTSTSSSLLTTTTTTKADTTTSSTTTERALPPHLHSDSVNNIPNEMSANLESTTTIIGNTIEGESTTQMPLIDSNNTFTTIESLTVSQENATLDEYVNSNLVETTTIVASAYTDETPSTDMAVKSSAYVRPVVPLPLLRPESNESSPLVITIANLDKVILSKVDRTISADTKAAQDTDPTQQQQQQQQETQLNTELPPRPVDSNAEFSSRFASVVAAPNNLIHETDAGLGITINSVGSTSSSSSSSSGSSSSGNESVVGPASVTNNTSADSLVNGSIVKETISFSTETRVVRKKKSRKHRGRKLRKSRKHNTATTIAPADVEAGVTLSSKSVSNADESAQNSSSTDLPDTTTTAPITTTTPRVRVVHIT